MASDRITKFENALIELIDMHMEDGLTGAEVRGVLFARAYDDFDAGKKELDLTRTATLVLPESFGKSETD